MNRLLVASLEIRWHGNELLFFHRESGIYLDIFRPYPEIAHLAIAIKRNGSAIGSCMVWTGSERKRGAPDLFFIGLEDYFNFPCDYIGSLSEKRGGGILQFKYLTPCFFNAGDIIEVSFDGAHQRFFSGKEYRRRFIEAVFSDLMANSFFGIEGVELLWNEFLSKYAPSHVAIAAMLNISRHDAPLFRCLCGNDEVNNADIIRGNELWDQWLAFLDTRWQAAISQKYPSGVLSLRGA